jgi:hypothetical protein
MRMNRDIDQIITKVKARVPTVSVTQMHKTHPSDGDGLWWFDNGNKNHNIQFESHEGMCPFMVETEELCRAKARTAKTVEQAVQMIVEFRTAKG